LRLLEIPRTEQTNQTNPMSIELKIYRINDCDWWLAETKEQAIADYRKHFGSDPDYSNPDEVAEMTDEEMDRFRFVYWDMTASELATYREQFASLGIEMREGNDWEGEDYPSVTFRRELQRRLRFNPEQKSTLFASSEH
jgi:hypothetical protein